MAKVPTQEEEPEILPDAWERFRTAIHVMTKAGPQHRIVGETVKSEPKHKTAQPKKEKVLGRNKDSVKKKVV
jgi:hypothetical protein